MFTGVFGLVGAGCLGLGLNLGFSFLGLFSFPSSFGILGGASTILNSFRLYRFYGPYRTTTKKGIEVLDGLELFEVI